MPIPQTLWAVLEAMAELLIAVVKSGGAAGVIGYFE
jgi:hypothetical protein